MKFNTFQANNNTFRTAQSLGTYRGNRTVFRVNGLLGGSDPVDIFKIKFRASASISSSRETYINQGGAIQATSYLRSSTLTGGRIQKVFSQKVGRGRFQTAPTIFPPGSSAPNTFTIYLKFRRPGKNARYSYKFVVRP